MRPSGRGLDIDGLLDELSSDQESFPSRSTSETMSEASVAEQFY